MTAPTWLSSVPYQAERGSFRLTPHPPQLRTSMDNGVARVRRRFTNNVVMVQFAISMSDAEFELFKSFYTNDLLDGTLWFTMPVWFGSEYEERLVRFAEAYEPQDEAWNRTRVAVKLETRGMPTLSSGASYILNEYGPEFFLTFTGDLEEWVNNTYPDITGD